MKGKVLCLSPETDGNSDPKVKELGVLGEGQYVKVAELGVFGGGERPTRRRRLLSSIRMPRLGKDVDELRLGMGTGGRVREATMCCGQLRDPQ
jgi:hypothetical protein